MDSAIVALLFHAGLRRSEAAALAWGDVVDASDLPGALLITIRTSKTVPDGSRADVRLVKGDCAAAKAAGIKGRITAHSGRVGLASELTRWGASVQEVMLAGNWTTSYIGNGGREPSQQASCRQQRRILAPRVAQGSGPVRRVLPWCAVV
ncbi:MAG: hypothetical protein OXH99_01250 [Bryobacterales bacterium]|nr:hypothetical protein [Bryobacterales bacterium]